MEGIKDKAIVITGASSGIGRETARLLASRGARLVVCARRLDKLEELAREIARAGGTALACAVDVTKKEEVRTAAELAVHSFGRLDVMINNAGVMLLANMELGRTDEWDRMIDVNIKGVCYGIAAALPIMLAQGYGQIVNTGSLASYEVGTSGAVYAGSKFAVRAISQSLRLEVGDRIKVTLVCPGVTETELGAEISDAAAAVGWAEMKRTAMTPLSIARAIAYAIEQGDDTDVSEILVRNRG